MTRHNPLPGTRRMPSLAANRAPSAASGRFAGPQSRFLAAARSGAPRRPTAEEERTRLILQAALVRRRLAEHHAAQRAQAAAAGTAPMPDAKSEPPRLVAARMGRRLSLWLAAPVLLIAVLAVIGAAIPVSSQTGVPPRRELTEQLQRLIDAAREAGLTDAEIRLITIEDSAGNVINAWEYLQDIERQKKNELARRQEEESRVYLTPRDVFKELLQREREDLDRLKDSLPLERERR